jgi:hypothetical protein
LDVTKLSEQYPFIHYPGHCIIPYTGDDDDDDIYKAQYPEIDLRSKRFTT